MLKKSLKALCNLEHRGASGPDKETGDGAVFFYKYLMTFFKRKFKKNQNIIKKTTMEQVFFFCGKKGT
ncbi:MAG: hypothetical protein CM15mP29_1530 [Alphaproteobacteria bacterium]|nr:MAG: hypothetical protein CM15mP29_1530 [Alphaproteobacteria bacterium]